MFLRLIDIEIRKTLRHPALWAGLVFLLILISGYVLIRHLQISHGFLEDTGGLAQDFLAGLTFLDWIGGFVYAVTAAVITAYDYPERGFQVWLTRGVTRSKLLSARMFVILFFCLLMVCLSVFALLGAAAASRAIYFGSVSIAQLDLGELFPAIMRIFWGSLPYLALTVLLAVISRSAPFAAAGMIIYANVFEKLLLSLADRYPAAIQILPGYLRLVLQANNFTLEQAAQPVAALGSMTVFHAVLAAGLIFVAAISLSIVIFSRQDLGG